MPASVVHIQEHLKDSLRPPLDSLVLPFCAIRHKRHRLHRLAAVAYCGCPRSERRDTCRPGFSRVELVERRFAREITEYDLGAIGNALLDFAIIRTREITGEPGRVYHFDLRNAKAGGTWFTVWDQERWHSAQVLLPRVSDAEIEKLRAWARESLSPEQNETLRKSGAR